MRTPLLKIGTSVVIVAGAALLIYLQYQTQQQLRAENDSLRQQIAQLKSENQDTPAANSKPTSSDDFNELLRLRGEVSALRSQTNQIARLQTQNQQLRDAFTNLAKERPRPAGDPSDSQEQAFGILQMSTAKQAILGMMLYAGDHNGESVTNFDQVATYFKAEDSATTNLSNFDITYSGPLANLANPSSAIVVRQIQPFTRNGYLLRAYGFGDGHSELHRADANGSFDEWEQQHVPVTKNQ
jgi:cell division protein FtsB